MEFIGRDKNGQPIFTGDRLLHDSEAEYFAYLDWRGKVRVHLEYCPDSALENGNEHIPITLDHMEIIATDPL